MVQKRLSLVQFNLSRCVEKNPVPHKDSFGQRLSLLIPQARAATLPQNQLVKIESSLEEIRGQLNDVAHQLSRMEEHIRPPDETHPEWLRTNTTAARLAAVIAGWSAFGGIIAIIYLPGKTKVQENGELSAALIVIGASAFPPILLAFSSVISFILDGVPSFLKGVSIVGTSPV